MVAHKKILVEVFVISGIIRGKFFFFFFFFLIGRGKWYQPRPKISQKPNLVIVLLYIVLKLKTSFSMLKTRICLGKHRDSRETKFTVPLGTSNYVPIANHCRLFLYTGIIKPYFSIFLDGVITESLQSNTRIVFEICENFKNILRTKPRLRF